MVVVESVALVVVVPLMMLSGSSEILEIER